MGYLGVLILGIVIGAVGVSLAYYKNGMLNIRR